MQSNCKPKILPRLDVRLKGQNLKNVGEKKLTNGSTSGDSTVATVGKNCTTE